MTADNSPQLQPDSTSSAPGRRPVTWWVFYAVTGALLLTDQMTKLAIVMRMNLGQSQPILGPYLSFTVQYNTGAAFGMFGQRTLGLAVLSAVVIAVLVPFGHRAARGNLGLAVALGLALGGAAGNLLDRVRLGYVIDFLDVHFWPVFNVADIGITCGAIMLVLSMVRRCQQRSE